MEIISWCNRIIKYSFYLLISIVPLILTPWNYELFEFNKMIVTYGFTVIIGTAWIIKMAAQQKLYIRRTPLDIPIVLFVGSQLVSSLFSLDPHVSWFGYYSRFNGGMISIFSYVLLYYAFVTNWGETDETEHATKHTHLSLSSIQTFFYCALGSAALVSLYGILERLGIDKHLWVQDVQNRVFSTLGQPNWLAAYIVALMPICLYFALNTFTTVQQNYKRLSIFGTLYVMFYLTLLFTRSRSGMLAFGATLAVFFAWNIFAKSLTKPALIFFLVIHGILGSITFFNGSNIDQIDKYFSYTALQKKLSTPVTPSSPEGTASAQTQPVQQPSGTLLEYGGTESGTIRKYVWEAAMTAWRSSQKAFFIGTGTESFAFAFFQYKPIPHNLTSEWDFLYNKAHNEYLNYLATTGIFGFGSYVLLLGVFTIWFAEKSRRSYITAHHSSTEHAHHPEFSLSVALFVGWLSLLITNFFGFSVVIIQIFLFLFPAIMFILNKSVKKQYSFSIPVRAGQVISILATLVGTVGMIYVGVMWMGDYFFASGYRLSRSGQLSDSYTKLIQATFLRPREPMYYDELSIVLGSLSVASLEAGNATAASDLATQSLAASDIALSISPNNVNFWKTRTKIYFGFADLDPKFVQAAKDSLEKAFALSPLDPKIAYNLAVLDGRLGNNEVAIETLKKTIELKPNYRDAYFALYVFYTEVKQPELARTVLQEYLTKVDPNDQEFLEKVKQ